jgi:hypothetical protein
MKTKTCTRCQETKAVGHFPTYPNGKPKSWCVECQRAYMRDKRKKQREGGPQAGQFKGLTHAEWHRKSKYGVMPDVYTRLLIEQGGVCAICSNPERMAIRGIIQSLAVDHDHQTGTIRGLLCNACNTGLGKFKESPDRLARALAYLRSHLAPS